ncbi:MAG: ComEC/Rec2 family competence protein [Bacteroidota bacterium]
MRLLNFGVIKLSLTFLAGILSGFYYQPPIDYVSYAAIAFFILAIGYHLWLLKSIHPNYTFSFLALLTIFSLGHMYTHLSLPENQPKHYIHYKDSGKNQLVQAKVSSIEKETDYYYKYHLDVLKLDRKQSHGLILLQLQKDSLSPQLAVGDDVQFTSELKAFQSPKNPQSFDYAAFMKRRLVYNYTTSQFKFLQVHQSESFSLTKSAENLRNQIRIQLEKAGFSKPQQDLIQALLLGQKKEIDQEIYDNFAKAGVVHILAVSGLHVGIVLLLLQALFYPLIFLKNGKLLRAIMVIFCLWTFALLAGFSPSVTRAATMFTFFAIAFNSGRKTNTINVLFISMVVLLAYRPQFIFEVGFQLSYAAVFSIVMLQPKFYKLYQPKFYLDKLLWGILTVTISAQLGVLPLSLYYFNQFPGLFMLANLVIIPFLTIILAGGFAVVILSFTDFLFPIIVDVYGAILDLLLWFVQLIAKQDDFVFTQLYLDEWMLISLVLMVGFFMFMVRNPKFSNFAGIILSGISFVLAQQWSDIQQKNTQSFIVFNDLRATTYGFKSTDTLLLYSTKKRNENAYLIDNYQQHYNIQTIKSLAPKNAYKLPDQSTLLVVDSTAIYSKNIQEPIVLLTNSPKLNLKRFISDVNPKLIIMDANNYKSYTDLWKKTCQEAEVDFHRTYNDGAWENTVSKTLID